MVERDAQREALGPAEIIIQSLLGQNDHMVHNRPGMVTQDARTRTGARWVPVTHKVEQDQKVVYQIDKVGKRSQRTRLGILREDGKIENGRVVGEYRPAGMFNEVAVWTYKQIAEVWKLDNEFAAKWASYAFGQNHKDLKVALAAFMLVQSRKGDPVKDAGEVVFFDEDYRDVGEAMALLTDKEKRLDIKMLLRIHELLSIPEIAQINFELGFGKSARKPFLGRWPKVVSKWLQYREENPKMLEGAVNGGWRTGIIKLAQRVRYKPTSPQFYQTLRWKQKQAPDGHRTLAIGEDVVEAESWAGLSEQEICEVIEAHKPNWKRVVGLLPKEVGVTRAVMAAAIEAGSLSDKDLIILTPTLEELGLLNVQDIRDRWQAAMTKADDMRAANIARNVKSKETKEKLQEAADTAVQKAVEEVIKGIRVYFMVDISGSMSTCIEEAKKIIAKFLQGFPADKVHVSTFNTAGSEITIKHPSAAGVEQAFRGKRAGGGTDYGAGIRVLQHLKPDADEDVLFIFVGDEGHNRGNFEAAVRTSGLEPMAFGLVRVTGHWDNRTAVQDTAARLGIPCFLIEEQTFEDPYAIPRTVRHLVAATPVGQRAGRTRAPRETLVDVILKTKLLTKPAWA
jgi:hypothetical protein